MQQQGSFETTAVQDWKDRTAQTGHDPARAGIFGDFPFRSFRWPPGPLAPPSVVRPCRPARYQAAPDAVVNYYYLHYFSHWPRAPGGMACQGSLAWGFGERLVASQSGPMQSCPHTNRKPSRRAWQPLRGRCARRGPVSRPPSDDSCRSGVSSWSPGSRAAWHAEEPDGCLNNPEAASARRRTAQMHWRDGVAAMPR